MVSIAKYAVRYSSLELIHSLAPSSEIKHQTAKTAACSENFFCGDDFDAALAIFCSYHYGENASEGVEKITADEKDDYKCSLCVMVWIVTQYQ